MQHTIQDKYNSGHLFTKEQNDYYFEIFDDYNDSALPAVESSSQTVSLFEVATSSRGNKVLYRYADLHDGCYCVFPKDGEQKNYNTNRIYHNNGPSEDGFFGIWTWSIEPSLKDPAKPYYSSQYSKQIDAIEIVIVTEASSIDDVVKKLQKDGFKHKPHSRKIMFSCYVARERKYTGILCKVKENSNSSTDLIDDCIVKYIDADKTLTLLMIVLLRRYISLKMTTSCFCPINLLSIKKHLLVVQVNFYD